MIWWLGRSAAGSAPRAALEAVKCLSDRLRGGGAVQFVAAQQAERGGALQPSGEGEQHPPVGADAVALGGASQRSKEGVGDRDRAVLAGAAALAAANPQFAGATISV